MIHIITEDNARFSARNYEELVVALKLDMWLPQTKEEYMEGVAKRCEVWDGTRIEYSTAEEFIHELRRVGVIKMMWSDEE